MKTPEEILNSIEENSSWCLSDDLIKEIILPAMEEYGNQQYNQGMKDAAENAKVTMKFEDSKDRSINRYVKVDKESILKLLKQ